MEEHDTYSDQIWSIDELPAKQGYYLQGNYLRCVAEVGVEVIFDNLLSYFHSVTFLYVHLHIILIICLLQNSQVYGLI